MVLLLLLAAALGLLAAHVLPRNRTLAVISGCVAVTAAWLLPQRDDFAARAILVFLFALGLGAIWVFALTKAVQVRRSPVTVGPQTMVGEVGEARRDDLVFVHGELWRARPAGDEPLRPGQRVRVASIGPELTLVVEPVSE